jgi:hypothetical protein
VAGEGVYEPREDASDLVDGVLRRAPCLIDPSFVLQVLTSVSTPAASLTRPFALSMSIFVSVMSLLIVGRGAPEWALAVAVAE